MVIYGYRCSIDLRQRGFPRWRFSVFRGCVTTGNLNKAMKRNIKRFPESFCFKLTSEECSRFQIGILNGGRGSNVKYLPCVYTEQVCSLGISPLP
ncbi:MAG: ORF6N domain-containing protein [Firmicutes bacterium]|nr:ORF6N domain-containing protein [Bacillota bacterium]